MCCHVCSIDEPVIKEMSPENRIKSLTKWQMVEVLVRNGYLYRASVLAGSVLECGHCIEWKKCRHCPLGLSFEDGANYACHELVCIAISFVNRLHAAALRKWIDGHPELLSDGPVFSNDLKRKYRGKEMDLVLLQQTLHAIKEVQYLVKYDRPCVGELP